MVTITSKYELSDHLASLGYEVCQVVATDGRVSIRYSGGTESEIQTAIDAYDPLPAARADAITRIKDAADQARRRYASPEKDGIYIIKAQQAQDYLDAVTANGGTELSSTAGHEFVISEQAARQLPTASEAARWILSRRQQWLTVMVAIEDIARPAIEQISAATVWQDCMRIADSAVTQLEAV